ncbi:PREDICTED: dol-P-Glc:Glc(2)Man(9)GlcNAc(2)-PP-Dol alpha-1,2-glucosyltransferase isoform X1 [Lupinus angustifolius]|uniref:dol-P-Glc:Glc(2)Man(9)GlcNAc(2)-PP-Dol alpha-1,2-glucosyltransferase isoform X1 n=2 Tax=Lupinus angustifolius TaxID=3871 RepID=UPI00092E26B3|nr:PREDICTED: dol-P-Glc:Glc(2)Man(9)GlcNAc(2)-PP-Dol alpha-1,2-glucosyltransferase isoform X1 [Lupinus angustifolius]XP_019462272.1 PREDICTED: dol-P-Glc:Glc(2)Man(9)GlcNAc(2)-PP-Dol alpha-1,2-glucosyltransferase isoform X1 [Lupinus angustifolius]XP_019462273.1 PREDICTED: dol-P-Glc:Glc(2)Man(9)GlcNAc(2)-PP-Dol alpha-1,2-glucosyltransferase isoform X1 [Lupinus angustifolius]
MGKLATAAIVSSWVVPITIMVNRIVPEPYMDEIFHIPQAQQYCKGNFGSWDPMITTPPGLYYLSLAHVASLFPGFYGVQAASSFSDMCSPTFLRSINGVLAVICSIIIYDIITHLKPTLDDRQATLHAVVLSMYPLHWFFTFLYYTDVASVTAVLAMYLASLKHNYWFSALVGAFAVVIRQTNIIWVLFVACTAIIDISLMHRKDNARTTESDLSSKHGLTYNTSTSSGGLNLRKRKFIKSVDAVEHSFPSSPVSSPSFSSGLVDEIWEILLTLWHMKWELLISFSPFLVVLVAFLLFVWWNGSVVLGAKEAHAVAPHFAQILYFSLVSVLALAPMHFTITQARELFQVFCKSWPLLIFQVSVALIAGVLSVHLFSIAHPYLLADNRHYPFYLWRKVIMAHWSIKYLLVPVYVCSWFSIIHMLGKFRSKIWILAYLLGTGAVLVPTPLIEFRYYTLPFYFLVLHCDNRDGKSWFLTGMLYIGVNIFTMMMFLFKPFHWDHESGIQRFIW